MFSTCCNIFTIRKKNSTKLFGVRCRNGKSESRKTNVILNFYNNQEIVIYEPSATRHFSHMSALFKTQATKERVLRLRKCAETSSRIEVCTIFFEMNISIFKLLPNSSQFSE
jgi:hypothetical protein